MLVSLPIYDEFVKDSYGAFPEREREREAGGGGVSVAVVVMCVGIPAHL